MEDLQVVAGFPSGSLVKNPPANAGYMGSIPTVFLPEKSLGQRSLVGHSPWGHKELDTTEQLSTHIV